MSDSELVVSRYEEGHPQNYQLDTEEQPPFDELTAKIDRFGYIHEMRLPENYTEEEARLVKKQAERERKWRKMLTSSKAFERMDRSKLGRRVYKGIPNSLRTAAWSRLLGVGLMRNRHSGLYQAMLEYGVANSPHVRQVDVDINRTLRDHVMFHERYGVKQRQLFHVLVAFSVYDAEVGYCQGMSTLAAFLLTYLEDEEDCFWALVVLFTGCRVDDRHIVSRYRMHGFFTDGFPKFQRFRDHHQVLLRRYTPRLWKHLEKLGFKCDIYLLKWLLSVFVGSVPVSLALRIWDIFLLEGERVLPALALVVVKMHERRICRLKLIEDVMSYFQKLADDYGAPDDLVVQCLQAQMDELVRDKMLLPYVPRPTAGLNAPANELPKHKLGILPPLSAPDSASIKVVAATPPRPQQQQQQVKTPVPTTKDTQPIIVMEEVVVTSAHYKNDENEEFIQRLREEEEYRRLQQQKQEEELLRIQQHQQMEEERLHQQHQELEKMRQLQEIELQQQQQQQRLQEQERLQREQDRMRQEHELRLQAEAEQRRRFEEEKAAEEERRRRVQEKQEQEMLKQQREQEELLRRHEQELRWQREQEQELERQRAYEMQQQKAPSPPSTTGTPDYYEERSTKKGNIEETIAVTITQPPVESMVQRRVETTSMAFSPENPAITSATSTLTTTIHATSPAPIRSFESPDYSSPPAKPPPSSPYYTFQPLKSVSETSPPTPPSNQNSAFSLACAQAKLERDLKEAEQRRVRHQQARAEFFKAMLASGSLYSTARSVDEAEPPRQMSQSAYASPASICTPVQSSALSQPVTPAHQTASVSKSQHLEPSPVAEEMSMIVPIPVTMSQSSSSSDRRHSQTSKKSGSNSKATTPTMSVSVEFTSTVNVEPGVEEQRSFEYRVERAIDEPEYDNLAPQPVDEPQVEDAPQPEQVQQVDESGAELPPVAEESDV